VPTPAPNAFSAVRRLTFAGFGSRASCIRTSCADV
jgi:hypothetical protein